MSIRAIHEGGVTGAAARPLLIAFASFILAMSPVHQVRAQTVGSKATTGISIVNNAGLSFGGIVTTNAPGTVVITPASGRTATGVVTFGAGGYGAASFTVTIEGNGNPHYTILLPGSVVLSGSGGATMTIDTFVSDPLSGKVDRPGSTQTIRVGGTLHIGATQRAGSYSGTFPVIVNLGN